MQVYANLRENSIVKIQDFRKLYMFSPGNPEFTLDTKLIHSLPGGGITQSKWQNRRESFCCDQCMILNIM